jgi:hypothetical protein
MGEKPTELPILPETIFIATFLIHASSPTHIIMFDVVGAYPKDRDSEFICILRKVEF